MYSIWEFYRSDRDNVMYCVINVRTKEVLVRADQREEAEYYLYVIEDLINATN